MAVAGPQEPPQAGVPSITDSFSQAAAAAAASMASIFPHQILFHHGSCKVAASAPPVMPSKSLEPSQPKFEVEEIYGFVEESSPLVLQSTLVESIGAGLANLGNTCFLNAVLQCLTYTPPLAAHLQSGLHSSSCTATSFCAMCGLERHVREALASSGRTVSPSYLVKNLRCISRSFQMWRQEDAHEYMRYLIEALQKCCSLELLGGKSLIKSVFGGRLRSQVKCTQCSHCSNKYDPFLDLSLEVTRADSLLEALAHFTAIEVLDGDNKYHCSRCNTKVRALKQFTIDKAPPILTVQLKRFSSLRGYGGKIDKKVHFESTLDLSPFVNGGEDEEIKYSLYAVLVHSGWSIHSGHYYCYVRTGMDGWHAMDDRQVSQVSERSVLQQKAYILFYARNTRPATTQRSNLLPTSREDITIPQIMADDMPSEVVANDLAEKQLSRGTSELDDEVGSTPQSVVSKTSNAAEEVEAVSLNDQSEGWYRAVEIIKSSCSDSDVTPETQATKLVPCRSHVDVISEGTLQNPCGEEEILNDKLSGNLEEDNLEGNHLEEGNRGDDHLEDNRRSDADSEVSPILDSGTRESRCLILNFTAPVVRTPLCGMAGQHAMRILRFFAKFCFWSCFWSPV